MPQKRIPNTASRGLIPADCGLSIPSFSLPRPGVTTPVANTKHIVAVKATPAVFSGAEVKKLAPEWLQATEQLQQSQLDEKIRKAMIDVFEDVLRQV